MIKIPVEIGDTILTGKFKNKQTVIKNIGTDEHGMPTINGKKVVTFRIKKMEKNEMKRSELKEMIREIVIEKMTRTFINEIKIDKYDIGMGYLGNGLSIWDTSREEHGDYKKIAHIGQGGKISWYEKKPTPKLKRFIEKQAKIEAKEQKKNPAHGMGVSQQPGWKP